MDTLKTTLIAVAGIALATPAFAEGGFKPNAPESFYADAAYANGTYPRSTVVNHEYNHGRNKNQLSATSAITRETADNTGNSLGAGREAKGTQTTNPKDTDL